MPVLTLDSIHYSPPRAPAAPVVAVGMAFRRLWLRPSAAHRAQMRGALLLLVQQLRAAQCSPEASIIALKNAIVAFGGVQHAPSLAADYHTDGDECVATWAEVLADFISLYYGSAMKLVINR